MMGKISLITVNRNNSKDTVEFLESLKNLAIPEGWQVETVLVDNGSTDDSVAVIKSKFPQIKILGLKENEGFVGGFNRGMKWAIKQAADYLLLLNNDTLIEDPGLLKKLLVTIQSDPQIGLVCPKIHFARGFEYHRKRYKKSQLGKVIWYAGGEIDWQNVYAVHRGVDEVDQGQYDSIEVVEFASGCCLLLRAEAVSKVGLFSKAYFANFEDADFGLRLKKAGFKLIYQGKTSLWHKVARTSGGIGSGFHDYFLTRNRLIFGFRWAPLKTKFALLKEALRFLFSGREFQKLAIRDFLLRKWGRGDNVW